MSKLNINRLTNENEDGAPKITGITSFSSSAFLETPKGTTAQRPENVSPGMIRFNTDSGHLEYYNGVEWTEVLVANNTLDGGARGIVGARATPGFINNIEYFTISSGGTSQSFGSLTDARERLGGNVNNPIRSCFFGGQSPAVNIIEFVTISTLGNAQDFGDLLASSINYSGASNPIRGIIIGSDTPASNLGIEYLTISSLGNSVFFGNLSSARELIASTSSEIRAVFAGGQTPSISNAIDYVTILTQGNAVDFGDLVTASLQFNGLSNAHGGL